MADPEPFEQLVLQTFRFRVELTGSPAEGGDARTRLLGDGGFQECSGLELEADIREYLEGGRNDGVILRVGRVKLAPIVLKRGMLSPAVGNPVRPELWLWLQGMVAGRLPVPRYDGLVEVLDPAGRRPRASWRFSRGLPSKVTGPALNARTGEIAIEELHILHEGLELVTS